MADASVGDLLFKRGEEDNEDIWDDRALIKAYDEAISAIKIGVSVNNGDSDRPEHTAGSSSARRRKNRNKTKKSRKWKPGDVCRAKFSEDGLLYEAEILSVDEASGTCFVRYTDYGNEEEQKLKDLLTLRSSAKKKKETESDIEGKIEDDSDASSVAMNSHKKSSASSYRPSVQPHFHPSFSSFPQFPFPSVPAFSGMPPPPPPPPQASTMGTPMGTMPIPPPPPPLLDSSDSDNEALCSMLMAWYMSGYHTGYYQGLKEGRKKSGAANPFVNR